MSDNIKEPEPDIQDDGVAIPPLPCPDYIETFNQAARLINGLPYEERARVLSALNILFEVTA